MAVDPIRAFVDEWARTHPATRQSYEEMVNAMVLAGLGVTRPTHDGGRKLSNDKIVDDQRRVWDVMLDEGSPNARWGYQPDGYFVDGKPASDPYGAPPLPDMPAGGIGSMPFMPLDPLPMAASRARYADMYQVPDPYMPDREDDDDEDAAPKRSRREALISMLG